MKNVICLVAALVLGLLASDAFSQECEGGSCRLPQVVGHVVSAPVNLTKHVVKAKPVRKVVGQPVRRVFRVFRCR
jgi:hypothetical protein